MQGEIESVSVKGKGLVMKKELLADELRIETNNISINSIKAAMNNIELNQSRSFLSIIFTTNILL